MNLSSLPPIISSALFIALVIIVFLKNRRAPANLAFGLLSLSTYWWQFSWFILFRFGSERVAEVMVHVGYSGVIFIAYAFYHFVVVFLNKERERKFVRSAYVLGFVFLIFNWSTKLFISGYYHYSWGYYPRAGTLHHFYLFSIFVVASRVIYLLYQELLETKSSPTRRNQVKYLLCACVAYILASLDFPQKYGVDLYPFGFLFSMISLGIIAYTIVKYNLMDINLLAMRAGLFFVVYGAFLILPLFSYFSSKTALSQMVTSSSWWLLPFSIGMYALLASATPFIYLFLRRHAEGALLKEQRRYQQLITNFSKSIVSARDLDELLRSVTSTVVEAVKVEFAAFYLRQEDYKLYRFQNNYPQGTKANLPEFISPDSPLISALNEKKRPLLAEEISRFDELNTKSGLLIPCFTRDGLLAVLLLGAKPRHQMFTSDDFSVFETLSYSFSLAIENCRFWKQLDERQREARLHEMDLFSYSLAHEIDNPMHIILNHAAFMKKWFLKYIPEGTDHANAAESCEYILEASKRVSTMVRAIQEFGQKTGNQPQPVKIGEVVESFSALYAPHFKMKSITFTTDISPQLPFIRGIKQELENVFVTITNNAVHAVQASTEKRIHLKVELTNQDWMRITFSDTGYGIKRENLLIIFKAFVTTKASSEGTGMGLYNAKNIIERHQGKIWAESEGEGKGATIVIELPVAKDIRPEELKRREQSKTQF